MVIELVSLNPYAAGGLFGYYKMMQKTEKWLKPRPCPCTLDQSSLSIKRVNAHSGKKQPDNFNEIV